MSSSALCQVELNGAWVASLTVIGARASAGTTTAATRAVMSMSLRTDMCSSTNAFAPLAGEPGVNLFEQRARPALRDQRRQAIGWILLRIDLERLVEEALILGAVLRRHRDAGGEGHVRRR